MNQIEATEIVTRVKSKNTSTKDVQVITKALLLLVAVESVENVDLTSDLIDGEKVQQEDLKAIGKSVGLRLLKARKDKKMSQESLEKKSKISQSTISKIEKGIKMISVDEAKRIAKALDITPQFLIAG
ncbi:MAG: helix-turn-helix transcriptional regulator [Bdellovibrionota bacterium]